MKKVIIAPKDTTDRIELEVDFYWQMGNYMALRFVDGRTRLYPMQHIWYLEIEG